MTARTAGPVAYCTIASANYLGKVQAWLESVERQDPAAERFVLLCEHPDVCARVSAETGFPFWSPADVYADWRDMAFYYDITELNTALKPFFLERILARGFGAVFYFDPDIEVHGSLDSMAALMPDCDVLLTPHVCAPIPADGRRPTMEAYLRAGQFNLGFIGVAATDSGRSLLRWWQDVCREHCVLDPKNGFFVDQFWASAFVSFADRCRVLRDPGCNVAYWNLSQRKLTRHGDRWMVDDRPLVFFHFSGLSEDDLTLVSRHQNRVRADPGTPLHDLLSQYAERVRTRPWHRYANTPYSFGAFAEGSPVTLEDRRKYLHLGAADRGHVGDPFRNKVAIERIMLILLSDGPRAYLTRIWLDRQWRLMTARGGEFLRKVRARGLFGALQLTYRFVARRLFGRE